MKKRNIIIISLLVAVFVTGIISGTLFSVFNGKSISRGTVLISDNGTCILIYQNSPIVLSNSSEKRNMLSDFESGDEILILHNGIQESYPAKTGVYFAIKTGDGGYDSIPDEVISSLKELGWITDTVPEKETTAFKAHYIRTDSPSEESPDTAITVMNTLAELELYKREKKDAHGLGESFTDKTKEFDNEFFINNSLITVFVTEGSGSITHNVREIIKNSNNELEIHIDRYEPEVGTCDMAYHHIIIEISKDDLTERDIKLFLDSSAHNETVAVGTDTEGFYLTVPHGWDYTASDSEILPVSIEIFNKNTPDKKITVEYTGVFGVCGTGLRTEDITIGDYEAVKGIYDNNPTWDYIHIRNGEKHIVFYNHTDGGWWAQYGNEAIEIMNSITIR